MQKLCQLLVVLSVFGVLYFLVWKIMARLKNRNSSAKASTQYTESNKEIWPPWVAYPGILPGDIFWRFGGEAYMQYAFLPYMQSLNEREKEEYLKRWNVPDEWDFFFDPELNAFLDQLDRE